MKPFLKPRALALLILSLQSFAAHAGDEIGNNWLNIIQGLESRGITQVGVFNVRDFRKKASRVTWHAMSEAPPSILAGARQTAFYYKPSKSIFVDTSSFGASTQVALPQLELHELMGATGYDDSSYQSSMALVEISEAPNAAEAKRLSQLYAGSIFNAGAIGARNAPRDLPVSLRGGGSGTSIGGGGDLNMISVKAQVLRLVKSWGGVSNEFLVAYPNVAFEPLVAASAREVVIEYRYEKQERTKKGYRETFIVYVPVNRWNEGAGAQGEILNEIAHKITAIFPTQAGGQTTTIVAPGCDSSQKVTYPYTQYPDIAALQRDRAMFVKKCIAEQVESSSSYAGNLPEGRDAPRQSGLFYFDCAFTHAKIPNGPYVINTQSVLGRGESKSLSIGWNGAQYLAGMAFIDRKGNIEGLAIAYTDGQGVRHPPKMTKAQDPYAASTQIELEGSPLTFSCQRR